MPHFLKNKHLVIEINLPNEAYNQARFDWTGKIVDVHYKGISLSGYEKDDPSPGEFIGKGFYNEFGIEKAIGFKECNNGDWFHKIGIGLLQKQVDEYAFSHPYKIDPLQFHVERRDDLLVYECVSPIINGYGYRYKKKIILNEKGFDIQYLLENIGNKVIETDEYNHNFVMIGNEKIDGEYVLNFPFKPRPGERGEVLNPNQVVQIEEADINFKEKPKSPFFYSYLNGSQSVPAQWALINKKVGIGISERGRFFTSKINLWGWEAAISPELFIDIKIKPGKVKRWIRAYNLFEIKIK